MLIRRDHWDPSGVCWDPLGPARVHQVPFGDMGGRLGSIRGLVDICWGLIRGPLRVRWGLLGSLHKFCIFWHLTTLDLLTMITLLKMILRTLRSTWIFWTSPSTNIFLINIQRRTTRRSIWLLRVQSDGQAGSYHKIQFS